MVDLLLAVDRDDGRPLYQQLSAALERRILDGAFQQGEHLPSSRHLAGDLGVSRNTVNAAYADLVAQGLVAARPRQGLFVTREAREALAAARRPGRPAARHDWASTLARARDLELEHVTKREDWYRYPFPFLAGQPDVDLFPTAEWARAQREALRADQLPLVLQDAQAADDPMLVDLVCREILPPRGVTTTPEHVLITLGSQQALHLVGQVLVRPGVRVAIEDPGYVDARNIFLLAGGEVVGVEVDEAGVAVDARLSACDLVYVTPSHQYPTNATLSFARRKRMLAEASEHDFLIVEDDYDSEFRYRGAPTVALKALDAEERVVYIGSFSKLVAPGLRLGYVVAAPELVSALRRRSRYTIRHPSGQLQRALALFIASGDYGRHVRRLKKHYKRKWEACATSIERHFDWAAQRLPPGGMSVWVAGPDGLDARALAERAQRKGVLIEPGEVCYLRRPRPANHFKVGFAAIGLESIEPGIAILAGLIRRMAAR